MANNSEWSPIDDVFFRRIRPQDVTFDHTLKRERPQSGCFTNDSAGLAMSSFSLWHLRKLSLGAGDVLLGYDGYRLIAMPGRVLVEDFQQTVELTEGDDIVTAHDGTIHAHPCNGAHVNIVGRKGKPLQKSLRRLPFYEV